jgi:hypothetical protein
MHKLWQIVRACDALADTLMRTGLPGHSLNIKPTDGSVKMAITVVSLRAAIH